ncbi:MAG: ABC transporter permease [Bacteroidales bacterium]|jgi:ABC-2 type transport system permease protein|nr:ABC transporter permease [Bacteroidales bacterium]
MNKIGLIISREYITRVRKRSFLLLTVIAPFFFAFLCLLPVWWATNSQKQVEVLVLYDDYFFINKFTDNAHVHFSYHTGDDLVRLQKEAIRGETCDAVLTIPSNNQQIYANLYSAKEIPMLLVPEIESQLDKILFDRILQDTFQINPDKFETIKNQSRSHLVSLLTDKSGNVLSRFSQLSRYIGLFLGFIIYLIIVMFSSQVLRGVLEEKNGRVAEVLLSTVKPLELMMGKIVGIALIGLTQFGLWALLTFSIVQGMNTLLPGLWHATDMDTHREVLQEFYHAILGISFSDILLSFVFYFLFGYLIYAALFAAIGAAADHETDTISFVLPVTFPLLLTLVFLFLIKDGQYSLILWWLSIIPFTSPVAMLARLPLGVPSWELWLSGTLLVLFFFFCVWLSAKIYRREMLMFGKKNR